MNKKRIAISVLMILVVLAAVSVLAPMVRTTKIDPSEFRILPVNKYYLEASRIASDWEKDSYFSHVSSSFTMPDDNGATLLITYRFRSQSKPSKGINILFVDTNPIPVEVDEGEDGIEPVSTTPIDVNSLTIDSIDALKIAYNNGGDDFIKKHRGINPDSFAQLGIENRDFGTDELMWRVTFLAGRYDVMYITINSVTGEVVERLRNDN